VLAVPPVVGRAFTEAENSTGAPVIVISDGLWQRRYGGDRSIVGQTLLMNDNRYEVIGVMPRGFVFRNREDAMKPGVYLSFAQTPSTWALPEQLVVRVNGNPEDVAQPLRRIIAAVDPDQPVSAVRTMDEIVDLDVADCHQQMVLLGARLPPPRCYSRRRGCGWWSGAGSLQSSVFSLQPYLYGTAFRPSRSCRTRARSFVPGAPPTPCA
jgi:hypothetical protein